MTTNIDFHALPVNDYVRDLVNSTIAEINNESTVFDASAQIEIALGTDGHNEIERYLMRSLDFVTGLIYSNGIEWDGESLTVGLDGSDDGLFESHVIDMAANSYQRIVNSISDIAENVMPNRLFGDGNLE